MNYRQQLKLRLQAQLERINKAERERPIIWSQTIYLGTLGLVMVLPIIAGAYLGNWLDDLMTGYSMRWTLSLMLTGVVVGIFNVYFLLKEK